jgi:hypothetical protein
MFGPTFSGYLVSSGSNLDRAPPKTAGGEFPGNMTLPER